MGLLDDLKRQAAQVEAHRNAQARDFGENVLEIDDAMHRAFLYLNDVVKQLNVLTPPSPRIFDLEPGLSFEGLRLTDFFIDFRKKLILERDRYHTISLSFQQKSPQVITVRKELPPNIARFENTLRTAGAEFNMREVRNDRYMVTHADFDVKCMIRSGVRITAEHETALMRFSVRNVERMGAFDLLFRAEQINDPMLEDCARYLLGEHNQFRSLGRYVTPGGN